MKLQRTFQLSIFGALTLLALFVSWLVFGSPQYDIAALKESKYAGYFLNGTSEHGNDKSASWRDRYYDQIFTDVNQTSELLTPNLADLCAQTTWQPDLYVNCTGIAAGLFNQVNEIKNCIRMAIDAGANLILPSIDERSSKKLSDFHHEGLRFQFQHFWDEQHILYHLGSACPQMKILPSNSPPIAGSKEVEVDVRKSLDFSPFLGHFDGTRTFRDFADLTIKNQTFTSTNFPIVLRITWTLLVMNPENDPTGLDWRAWTELCLLLRATPLHQQLIRTLSQSEVLKKESYIGVHLRVEADAIGALSWWDDFEMQKDKNLKAIDVVAARYREGPGHGENPSIYVACGEQEGIEKFRQQAALRGYTVVDKWGLLANDTATLNQLNEISFDARGLLDYAILLNSYFFIGTHGSSFSYTIANMRSEHGKYPGSSFAINNAEKSFSHLFMPPPKRAHFACCL